MSQTLKSFAVFAAASIMLWAMDDVSRRAGYAAAVRDVHAAINEGKIEPGLRDLFCNPMDPTHDR